MDTDSCFFSAPASDLTQKQREERRLPYLPKRLVYKAVMRLNGEGRAFTHGLVNITLDFIKQHNVTIQNPELWRMVEEALESADPVIPNFYNNLELDRIEFFRDRPLVRSYLHRIAEEAPPRSFAVSMG